MTQVTSHLSSLSLDDAGVDEAATALAAYLEERHDADCAPARGILPAADTREEVITELIGYVRSRSHPRASVVWALGKAHDQRAQEPLATVLLNHMASRVPQEQHLAFQALVGLKSVPQPPLEVIGHASRNGVGKVRDNAQRYVDLVAAPPASNSR